MGGVLDCVFLGFCFGFGLLFFFSEFFVFIVGTVRGGSRRGGFAIFVVVIFGGWRGFLLVFRGLFG